MAEARCAKLRVVYDNHDISASISPYVVSATFTDNAHGKADSVSITVEDRDYLWQGSWKPSKGATLKVWIDCTNWYGNGQDVTMYCGSFEIDGFSFDSGTGGDRFAIKGVSANVKNSLRREQSSRSWENASIRLVARELAKRAEMDVVYEAADVMLDRVDQVNEGDLGFLKKLAEQNGMSLKVAESSLIFFDGAKFDARPATVTLQRGDSAISSVRMSDGISEVYKSCEVSYHDPATKEDLHYKYTPEGAPTTGQTLKINSRVKTLSEAMKLAKNKLRQKNKDECKGSVSVMGDPRLRGSAVIALKGYLNFSGNYFVESATHSIDDSGGYTTSCSIRKTLSY
ncbi:MAG: phage late control D family protein [Desulfovibrio sp.]